MDTIIQEMMAINILIGDRSYRIKINPRDEQTVRKVVKVINDKMFDYKREFAGKDMQDYVAMVLLWFATSQIDLPNISSQPAELESDLRRIEDSLDKALREND